MKKTPLNLSRRSKTFKWLFGLSILLVISGGIAVWILLRTVSYTLDEARTYDYEGKTITQDIHISVDGVKLKNVTVEGDLYVDESVGEGHIELENVTATGMTYVYGGGKDTVMIIGGHIHELLGEFNGRLMAINWATMEKVVVKSSDVILKTDENTSFKRVELDIPEYGEEDKPVQIDGNVEELVDNGEADITVKKDSNIKKYIPSCLGEGCVYPERTNRVNMEEGSKIEDATVAKPTIFDGEGTIDEMDVQSEDVEVDVDVEKVESEEGYDIVTAEPAFVGTPVMTNVDTSNGDYTLSFEVNMNGTIYYILQPPTNFTVATPTVSMVKSGQGNSVCSAEETQMGDCPPRVVSKRTLEVADFSKVIVSTGYFGDSQGMRPIGMEDFDPSCTLFAVFVNGEGEETDVLRVEF